MAEVLVLPLTKEHVVEALEAAFMTARKMPEEQKFTEGPDWIRVWEDTDKIVEMIIKFDSKKKPVSEPIPDVSADDDVVE